MDAVFPCLGLLDKAAAGGEKNLWIDRQATFVGRGGISSWLPETVLLEDFERSSSFSLSSEMGQYWPQDQ